MNLEPHIATQKPHELQKAIQETPEAHAGTLRRSLRMPQEATLGAPAPPRRPPRSTHGPPRPRGLRSVSFIKNNAILVKTFIIF